jgi:hypothetical protein
LCLCAREHLGEESLLRIGVTAVALSAVMPSQQNIRRACCAP